MDQTRIQQIEGILKTSPDNEVLQYTLGLEYLNRGDSEDAIRPLRTAIRLKPDYSAAYRELGKALARSGSKKEAVQIYQTGIEVAERQGDIQTAKEMKVFLKRLDTKID